MGWCETVDHDRQTRITLLTAVAGAGKSAVAHTVAHLCEQRGILLSFFRAGKTTSPQYLWSGVARSLAIRSESYRQKLTSIMENDPTPGTDAFDEQFRRLILEPLRDTPTLGDRPLVIVIDGFDECEDIASQTLAKLLRDYVSELPRWVKFFLTSRPVRVVNPYLRTPSSIHHMSIEISDEKNLRDYESYIAVQVSELEALPWPTPPNWPPNLQDMLVKHAHGLFIWVSVVMEYMRTKSMNPVVAIVVS